MNKKQLVTMLIGITLFILSLLFPPWLVYEETLPPKPRWVYDKQEREFIPPMRFAPSGYYFDKEEREWKPNTYIPPSSMEWVKEELDRLSLENSGRVLGYSLSDIKRVVKTDYISVLQAPYAKVVGYYIDANVGYDSNVIVGYPNDACGTPAYGSRVTVQRAALISKAYKINYFYLGLQLIIVVLVSGGLVITFRDKKPRDE